MPEGTTPTVGFDFHDVEQTIVPADLTQELLDTGSKGERSTPLHFWILET